ncbi:MAG: hypothetical protein ACQETD_08425 [Pseudomonadota bacterium]
MFASLQRCRGAVLTLLVCAMLPLSLAFAGLADGDGVESASLLWQPVEESKEGTALDADLPALPLACAHCLLANGVVGYRPGAAPRLGLACRRCATRAPPGQGA